MIKYLDYYRDLLNENRLFTIPYWGWMTPDGKYLKIQRNHTETLKANNIQISPDDAVQFGYSRLAGMDNIDGNITQDVECRADKVEMVVKWLKQNLNEPLDIEVTIEYKDRPPRLKTFKM